MSLQIKNWETGAVLYEHEGDDLREAVEAAVENGADLRGARLDDVNLDGAFLRGARLDGASFDGASFVGAFLCGARFDGAFLRGANFRDASLNRASLDGAFLRDAILNSASLRGASINGASINGASINGASINGASINGASFDGANLDGEVLVIPPASIANLAWRVLITPRWLTIGCQRHTHEAWAAFGDDDIASMDKHGKALPFWRTWKTPLMAMCAAHRAEYEAALAQKEGLK